MPVVNAFTSALKEQAGAIKKLQQEVIALKQNGHKAMSDDVNAPASMVDEPEQGQAVEPQADGNNQLNTLQNIMALIANLKGGNSEQISMAGLEKLLQQREALDKLIPPNPYEALATKLGIAVMDNFAKRLGVQAIDNALGGSKQ